MRIKPVFDKVGFLLSRLSQCDKSEGMGSVSFFDLKGVRLGRSWSSLAPHSIKGCVEEIHCIS